MTIPEVAREYNCNESALYQKFRRNKKLLEGHYRKKGNVILIDDYVVDFLLPKDVKIINLSEELKRAEKENKEYGRKVFDEREYRAKIHSLTEEISETERKLNREKVKVEEMEQLVKSLKEENSLLGKENKILMDEKAELEKQLSSQSANKRNGVKGFFGKH